MASFTDRKIEGGGRVNFREVTPEERADQRAQRAASRASAPAPDVAPTSAPAPSAPSEERQQQAPAPTPEAQAPAPDVPENQVAPVSRPVRPTEVATAGNRPGSAAAQEQLLARSGFRLGAFDPRQRGVDQEQRGILAALGAAGVPQNTISAANSPTPPSLGFNARQFEDEQRILGALRG